MKKILSVILCIAMLATVAMFTACSDDKKEEAKPETTAAAEKKAEAFAVKDSDSESVKAVKNVLKNRSANANAVAQVKAAVATDAEQTAVVEEAKTVTATNDAPYLGTWKIGTGDMSSLLEDMLAESQIPADFSSFEFNILLSITEDKFAMTFDSASAEKEVNELCDELILALGNWAIAYLEENGVTLEDFENEIGISFDEFLNQMEAQFMAGVAEALAEINPSYETSYTADGNTLINDEGEAMSYSVNGNTLTFGEGEEAMVFTRV